MAEPPFPMKTGHPVLPDDLQGDIGFITLWGAAGIRAFWLKQLPRIQQRADELTPCLHKLRSAVGPSREPTRARIRAPLLKELSRENGTVGSEWRDQFATGFPISGELGEPGGYLPSNGPPSYFTRELLFASAPERLLMRNRASGPNERQLWIRLSNAGWAVLVVTMRPASFWLDTSQWSRTHLFALESNKGRNSGLLTTSKGA